MGKVSAGNKLYLRLIYGISILIPVVVAALIFMPSKFSFSGEWVGLLPGIHAAINSLTVVVLIGAFMAVKRGNVPLHMTFMLTALFLGVLFLISYIIYHSSVDSVKFGDLNSDGVVDVEELERVGALRTVYLIVLASHILLSIVVVPFVLFAFYYALTDQIEKHRRLVKFTFPVWVYVSVTGVIVYFMIEPYYL